MLYMKIVLKRRPLFIILTVVLPIIALSIMHAFCFLLPMESGEKMGLSVALFHSFGVFGSIMMTQNAANISWFVVYVTTQKVGRLLLWEQLFCTCIIWMSVYQLQLAATKCVKQMLSNTEQQVNLITHFSVKSVTLEQQSLM